MIACEENFNNRYVEKRRLKLRCIVWPVYCERVRNTKTGHQNEKQRVVVLLKFSHNFICPRKFRAFLEILFSVASFPSWLIDAKSSLANQKRYGSLPKLPFYPLWTFYAFIMQFLNLTFKNIRYIISIDYSN